MRPVAGVIAACIVLALTSAGQADRGDYLLYVPRAAETDKPPAGPAEGVLVRRVTVRQGDTLKKLAREYRGESSYFPQILLFNRISNPDLIHAGDKLQVPVTNKLKSTLRREKRTALKRQHVSSATKKRPPSAAVSVPPPAKRFTDLSQQLYQAAVSTYKKGHYRQALKAFERFLSSFPDSPLAADASLYRADCFLNLSRQQ